MGLGLRVVEPPPKFLYKTLALSPTELWGSRCYNQVIPVLVVTGPRGCGKSTLAQQLRHRNPAAQRKP